MPVRSFLCLIVVILVLHLKLLLQVVLDCATQSSLSESLRLQVVFRFGQVILMLGLQLLVEQLLVLEAVAEFRLEFHLVDESPARDHVFHPVQPHNDGSLAEFELHWVLFRPLPGILPLPALLRELKSGVLISLQNSSIVHHVLGTRPLFFLLLNLLLLAFLFAALVFPFTTLAARLKAGLGELAVPVVGHTTESIELIRTIPVEPCLDFFIATETIKHVLVGVERDHWFILLEGDARLA